MFHANSFLKLIFLSGVLVSASGCASIVEGRSQDISVNTDPPGAVCVFTRNNVTLGFISPTPGTLHIRKTKHDIVIKCSKPGYQDVTYMNKSDSAGATFGNILAGGLIGWGVDSAAGADNKYESPVNLTLVRR